MNNKKIISLIVVILFLIPIGISSRMTSMSSNTRITVNPKTQTSGTTFIYGTDSGPIDIDTANAYDQASYDVLTQICEQLYQYNMSDPTLPIIPWLASEMPIITNNGTEYTINLRPGITFSDGMSCNATAVADSFYRLNQIIQNGMCQFSYLYQPFAPENNASVIDNVVANTNNSVTFILPYQYSPFLALLTFMGSSILSPSITTNTFYYDNLMEPGTWQTQSPIGTGPFILESYTVADQVLFAKNPNYWGGPDDIYTPHIDTLKFQIIEDINARNNALLNGSIQMITPDSSYFSQFNMSSNILLVEGPKSTLCHYLGMNTLLIPKSIRQACSHVFNYNDALQTVYNGSASRLTSVIPIGMNYFASNLNYPTNNVTEARQILINADYVNSTNRPNDYMWLQDPTNDTAWYNILESGSPLATYNYTCNLDLQQDVNLGEELQIDLGAIGINLVITAVSLTQYGNIFYQQAGYSYNNLEFFPFGWQADYNDPQDYINTMFVNTGPYTNDYTQLNDTYVNTNASLALNTTNDIERAQYYTNIQKRLVENLMPVILVSQANTYYAMVKGVCGFQPNAMGYNYFAPVNYTPMTPTTPTTPTISLTAPQDFNAIGGNGYVFLSWGPPTNANQMNITGYRIYRGNSSGNETVLVNVGESYNYNDTNVLNNQTYYYEISAFLSNGTIGPKSAEIIATPHNIVSSNSNSSSNVTTNNSIPGYNLIILSLTMFASIGIISVLTKKKHI